MKKGIFKKYLALSVLGLIAFFTLFVVTGCNKEYTINYQLYGGVNSPLNLSTYNEDTGFVLAEPTNMGYMFGGWFTDEEFTDKVTRIDPSMKKDITLYAKWIVNKYTLTFVDSSGETIDTITADYASEITFPELPVKQGYASEWYTELWGYGVCPTTTPAMDMTICHKYEPLFELNGNTITGLSDYAQKQINLELVIPDNIDGYDITRIDFNASYNGAGLVSIKVDENNTVYDSRENCNAIIETATNTLIIGCASTIIPSSVTSIGDYAFSNCDSLTSITIPSSVTSIGQRAFYDCDSVTSITIPSSVTSIGDYAFYNCDGLTNVIIEEGVTSIGKQAFRSCDSLTSITIPSSVTSIGEDAFQYCDGLTEIIFKGTQEQWNAINIGSNNSVLTGGSVTIRFEPEEE